MTLYSTAAVLESMFFYKVAEMFYSLLSVDFSRIAVAETLIGGQSYTSNINFAITIHYYKNN